MLGKLFGGLKKTRQSITGKFAGVKSLLSGSGKIDDDTLEELEEALILADVGATAAAEIIQQLKKISPADSAQLSLAEIIASRFGTETDLPENANIKPKVVLIVGVNGSGKTTTIAKLAKSEIVSGGTVLMAAADTFRAAAGEQLEHWADTVGADIIRQADGSDPAAVAFDAVKAGIARGVSSVIIDTAGRLQTKSNLMEELKKIKRVVGKAMEGAPHEVLMVMDATTGQNGLSQIAILFSTKLSD